MQCVVLANSSAPSPRDRRVGRRCFPRTPLTLTSVYVGLPKFGTTPKQACSYGHGIDLPRALGGAMVAGGGDLRGGEKMKRPPHGLGRHIARA